MINWFILLSDTAAAGVRIITCLFLISRLLSAGKPNKRSIAAGLAGAIILSMLFPLCSPLTRLLDFAYPALETVWLSVCASRLQNTDTRLSLCIAIFYEITAAFWQFLFAAWLGVAFHSPAFLDSETANGQIAIWLLHALFVILTIYLYSSHNLEAKKIFHLAAVIALAGFLAIITLSEQTTLAIASDTLGMWMILSIVLMMFVLIFNISRQYELEKELAKLKTEQAKLLERDYTALNNIYTANAKLFHDLHNHIGVLRQLLSHQKTEEAIQYLDELQAPIQQMTNTIWSGDETVDYLINSKIHAADADGILLNVQIEFPRHTNIRSADLCTILGNLLDNALEATKQVPSSESRLINLTIRRINQMIIIKVENNYTVPPVNNDDSFKTTKENNGLHGLGLLSARTAAEKYDGTVQTSYHGNTFRAVATLSYQVVSME